MNEPKQAPPRDDAELTARIEVATRPAAFEAGEHARFRAGIDARLAGEPHGPRWWALGFAATATAALVLLIATRAPTPSPTQAQPPADTDYFAESYEEQLLFAPEWIQRHEGFVDAEILPDDYALASALVEP